MCGCAKYGWTRYRPGDRRGATRGVGYWQDSERDDLRVIVVSGEQLVGLDARTCEDGALPSACPFFLIGEVAK